MDRPRWIHAAHRLPGSLLFAAVAFFSLSGRGAAEEAKPANDPAMPKINYDEHVLPVLREHCFTCHSQDTAKSDLALDSYSGLMRGGASGEVIEPGDLDTSRLWQLVSHQEAPEMPPEQDKLPEAKLEVIKAWIVGGALENSGSTVKIKKKPTIDLLVSAGSSRPEGPPPMPEGLIRQPVVYTPRASAATAIASSPWAPLVAVAGQKQIALYHSDTAALLGVLPFPEGMPHVLKFSRSGALLLAGGGRGGQAGLVAVYDVRSGDRVFQVGDELDVVLAADINNNHSLIALGGPRRVVRIYSAADGTLLHELKKHTEWITALEFSPDGVLLATADRNGGLFVWEADTAREYQNLAGHTGSVTDVSWRLDSNVLASASEDTTIRLWEMENGAQVKNWGAHAGGALSVDFTHDGRLLSAGRDNLAKAWDQAGSQLRAFEPFSDLAMEASFTHDGARAVAGDWTGDIRMWDVADGKLIARLPMNPPTLEMAAAAAAEEAALATAAAQQAADEAAAAQQAAAEKAAALQA
ncbi:MAG: c-type cytochrome domain-containing protein, partial [Pirellulales bacterium]